MGSGLTNLRKNFTWITVAPYTDRQEKFLNTRSFNQQKLKTDTFKTSPIKSLYAKADETPKLS